MSDTRPIIGDFLSSTCGLSTYQNAYKKPSGNLRRPIKYSQPPGFELDDVSHVKVRQFPLIPVGPRRRLELEIAGPARPALAPGLGTRSLNTERLLDKKPILQTPNPRKAFKKDKENLLERRKQMPKCTLGEKPLFTEEDTGEITQIDRGKLNTLLKEVTWSTTTQRANEEGALSMPPIETPCTTFEENADMIKLRPRRYEDTADKWQKVAPVWERVQMRPHTERWLRGPIEGSKPRNKHSNRLSQSKSERIDVKDNISRLVKEKRLSKAYERPCPGYAGFLPRSPVDVPLEETDNHLHFETVMKASYNNLSSNYNNKKMKVHRGPMSQLVTLTYPYNPFNKVEKRTA